MINIFVCKGQQDIVQFWNELCKNLSLVLLLYFMIIMMIEFYIAITISDHWSASQCIITTVILFCINYALTVHYLHLSVEHSGHSPFHSCAHANSTTITLVSYRISIYTPGWTAAMWIECLAEWQKYRAMVGIEPWPSEWDSSVHTNTALHWQKEATLENDIFRKWAECVCHVHLHQCNVMMFWLKYV